MNENDDEIVRELRESLPPKIDYAELVGAERFAHGACYVWDDPLPYLMSNAADLLESQQARITALEAQLANARNELCQRCGRYREAHKGACDGCRWKELQNVLVH